ncbi:MAG: type II secretion system protein [Oceanospirillaceae bacterium]|nr:type II secretion system protein [Oceanospirillaceae bacterium]MCP5335885.1 type II secretion system protein [Oceanospirillaceae bacterium]MCP5350359.1 type II secretion system protein [Oceanospirillaceae bacterium]
MPAAVFKQTGTTLVELVITIVILGIALATLSSALSAGISRGATPGWEGKALELSQAYADEILGMKFDAVQNTGGGPLSAPCGISSDGQNRADFDDVDDYNGLSDSPPTLITNTVDMSQYQNYRVDVSVNCAGTEAGFADNRYAKRITITVYAPAGDSRVISFYRGNF